jgi:hypothetical protein
MTTSNSRRRVGRSRVVEVDVHPVLPRLSSFADTSVPARRSSTATLCQQHRALNRWYRQSLRHGYDRAVLHGRAPECAAIDAVLHDARASRSGCLMIRGEPGVGTTALLSYAVEHASTMRVLTGAGTPSESGLPFAALHQLLRPVLGHLAAIPELQAAALEGALAWLRPTATTGS